jgi:hypothetical protein
MDQPKTIKIDEVEYIRKEDAPLMAETHDGASH